jgi:hypothetical protein
MTPPVVSPYGRILDEFAVVASDHSCENELGCAAYATRSLLAPQPDDPLRRERLDRRLHSLGGAESSTFRDGPGELLAASWFSSVGSAVRLHEGYMVDPAAEASAEIEKLRIDLGDRFWATAPEIWSAWGTKGRFRRRCRGLLGERSTPPGRELTAEHVDEVVDALTGFEGLPAGRTIVKLPGSGGMGNVVLDADARETWPDRIDELWAENRHVPKPADVVIEAWLPWEQSFSASFLLEPGGATTLMAVCEQIVEPTRGSWVGSRTDRPLSDADTTAMLALLQRVIDAMAADGFVGVAALDVIVGRGDGWAGDGLDLPSGRRLCVIECNPRWNQHNRIGLVVERLARRWGLNSRELSWSLKNIDLPVGTTLPDLLASLEDDRPGIGEAPTRDRAARMVFAHRFEKAMELTVSLAGQSAPSE